MSLPDMDDLDAMADLISPGSKFAQLGPEARMQVIGLTNQSDLVDAIKSVETQLENIGGDTEVIKDWFRCSKLWEGN